MALGVRRIGHSSNHTHFCDECGGPAAKSIHKHGDDVDDRDGDDGDDKDGDDDDDDDDDDDPYACLVVKSLEF